MTRCSCKTGGINLKTIFWSDATFQQKNSGRMMAPDRQAWVLHVLFLFIFYHCKYHICTLFLDTVKDMGLLSVGRSESFVSIFSRHTETSRKGHSTEDGHNGHYETSESMCETNLRCRGIGQGDSTFCLILFESFNPLLHRYLFLPLLQQTTFENYGVGKEDTIFKWEYD